MPTITPNATETAQYDSIVATVKDLYNKGYIPSLDGRYIHLDDYLGLWAQIGWYTWKNTPYSPKDFLLKAHMDWESASHTPNPSGCGITFRIQKTNEHYVVFVLSTGYIQFAIRTDSFHSQGYQYYGPPANTGNVDFLLVAVGNKISVFINGKYINAYTGLSGNLLEGKLGYTTLSGTNASYGTRCNITQADLWEIQK